MTWWILFIMLISPSGELLDMEQLEGPFVEEKTCIESRDRAVLLPAHPGTWFICQPIRGMVT